MTPVGIVGAGLLGSACARRLQEGGFDVRAYDVDPSKSKGAASLQDLLKSCSTVVLCVFDTAQVREVVEQIREARDVVCCSTCDPDELAEIAGRAVARGIGFVEMPISGSSGQVAAGDGVGFVAGSSEAIKRLEKILATICPRRTVLGKFGDPLRAKLAINLILGLNRAALAEGLVLAERLGLDVASFLDAAKSSAAYSQAMDVKGTMMAKRAFVPAQGRIKQSLKDFGLMLAQARAHKQELPFASVYVQMLEDCLQHGEADWDNAAILAAIWRKGDS